MDDTDIQIKKHFVRFLSPGTFFSEETEKEIDSWDVEKAMEMALEIKERHGARPYGFSFLTRGRRNDELDSRVIARSNGIYYLGGQIRTLEQVEQDNLPNEEILRGNMRINNHHTVITNTNSWKITLAFEPERGDTLLDFTFPA